MALALGSLSLVSVGSSTAVIAVPASTGGSGVSTYQLYRSTTPSFSPAGSLLISSSPRPSFADSGLIPGVVYYYEAVATDAAAATASSAQLQVATVAYAPNPNQASLQAYLGMLDQQFNGDTLPVQFDPAGSGSLIAGQAVVFSQSAPNSSGNTAPLVIPSLLGNDLVAGFVNYNIKNAVYLPGARLEISMLQNVQFLMALSAINRGSQVNSVPAAVNGGTNGGVVAAVSGSPWVGICLDQAVAGQLCRVFIQTPANSVLHS